VPAAHDRGTREQSKHGIGHTPGRVQHPDSKRAMSGLARFGALGHSGLSPDTVVATEEGEVIIDRPAIREPDLGVRGRTPAPTGIQPKPHLRDASGQEKPRGRAGEEVEARVVALYPWRQLDH
jgi:hypothetical protein